MIMIDKQELAIVKQYIKELRLPDFPEVKNKELRDFMNRVWIRHDIFKNDVIEGFKAVSK